MALQVNTVWEVRTAGSDTNGGGFTSGASGTDWSQQNGTQYSVTDGVTAGTTTITSATANFGTDVVGNIMYVQGGTGSIAAGWYQITSRTNSTTIVVDRSTGLTAGTGATLNIGGALASPGQCGAVKVAGNQVWIKSGTYSITSASNNVAGGCVSDTTGGTSQTRISRWEGYGSSRGDKGTRPLLQASGISSATMVGATAVAVEFDNLSIDCASLGTMSGLVLTAAKAAAIRCKVANATVSGLQSTVGDAAFARCEATGCSGTAAFNISSGASAPSMVSDCEAYGNTTTGFLSTSSAVMSVFIRCIASANTGGTTDGFGGASRNGGLYNCVSYGNGRHGFNINATGYFQYENSIAEGNAGYGFTNTASVSQNIELYNCAGYNNTSGDVNATQLPSSTSFQALTGSPFTNAGSGDFSLNNTASAGAACRAAGYPGLMPQGTTTGYLDIGVAQHQDSGGGGTVAIPIGR